MNKNEAPPQEQPQAAPMDGASPAPSSDPMAGEQPPMDGQDPAMGDDPMMSDPAMGGEEQPPIDGQDPAMSGDPMMSDPAMGGEQPPMEGGEGDDSTMSIINQLSDEDREAVRAYAESMLSRSEDGQESPVSEDPMMDGPAMGGEQQPMMESFIFTKKQLKSLMENFGPTEDELQKQDKRKPLPKKKEKTVSTKSPFNSPKFK